MGKINISVDTESKVLAVKVDGKEVPLVREVYAYQSFDSKGNTDGFSISVTTVEASNDIRKVTTYVASGSEEARKAEVAGNIVDRDTITGFVGIAGKTDMQKSLEEYFHSVL